MGIVLDLQALEGTETPSAGGPVFPSLLSLSPGCLMHSGYSLATECANSQLSLLICPT
jgi:hypothetical protein